MALSCDLIFDLHNNVNNVNYHIEDPQQKAVKNNIREMELIKLIDKSSCLFISTDGFITFNNVKSDAKVFYFTTPNQISPALNANWFYLDLYQSAANYLIDYIAIDSYNSDCFFAYNKHSYADNYVNNTETFYIDKYQYTSDPANPWVKPLGWDCSKNHQNSFTVGSILAGFGTRYNGFKVIDGSNILVGGYELNLIKNYNYPGLVDFSIFHAPLNPNENYAKNNSYHYGIRTIENFLENIMGTDGGISRIIWDDQNSSIASVNNINNKGLAISQINSMSTTKNSKYDIIINNAYRNGLWQYKCDKWDNYYWEDGGNILLDEIDRDLNDNGEPDYVHNFTANINWSFPMYPYIQQLNYCTFSNCVGTAGIYPAYINLTSQAAYSNNQEWNYNTPMEFSNSTKDNVLHGLHNIYQSSDFGQTWLPITANAVNNYPQPNYWSGSLEVIRVSQNNPNIMYIAFSNPTWSLDQNGTTAGSTFPLGKIYRGQKGTGGNWNWVDITAGISNLTPNDLGRVLKFTSITDIAINPFNSDEIWVSFNNYDGTDAITGKYRVLRYNYNTNVWTDYSDGLTAVPVNCITINKYSNINEMFVGTDIGVFYRNSNMNKWELFHKSNPKWIVTDLSINYEKMLLRAATWGRSIWETPIKCSITPPTDYEITQSSTNNIWNSAEYNVGNIVIQNGAVLTINADIEMAEAKSITVYKGGKLIVNNARISGYCSRMWDGIVIDGDNTMPQTDNNSHGKVILNYSRIEDAIIAVECKDLNNTQRGGGCIIANYTSFINNLKAVKMHPYSSFSNNIHANNLSEFYYCNFIIDQPFKLYKNIDYNINYLPKPYSKKLIRNFVEITSIKGLDFTSCKFSYENKHCNSDYIYTGIKALNSSFNVLPGCSIIPSVGNNCPESDILPSIFTGLEYGIVADKNFSISLMPGGLATSGFKVIKAEFNNNKYGLYTYGCIDFYILSNKFIIPFYNMPASNSVPNPVIPYYGAYIDNCKSGIHIEDNQFGDVNEMIQGFIGLYVNNSGKDINTIYNNRFNFLSYNVIARGHNGPDGGLKLKCNDFHQCYYDVSVIIDPNSGINGISKFQGRPYTPVGYLPSDPAGNTFESGSTHNFYNECSSIEYYRHEDIITKPNITNNLSGNTNINNTHIQFDKSTACPAIDLEPIGVLIDLPAMYEGLNIAQQQLNSARLIYQIWVDGGNTEALKQAVNLALPYEAYDLYNNLISKSPYLSDEVMIDAIKREEVLPPLMLKMVLLANPKAIYSARIMEALNRRINPLPEAWIDELKQGSSTTSPREQLESEIDYAATNKQQIFNKILSVYAADTSATYVSDSLIALYQRENSMETDIDLLYFYINSQMTDEASQLLDEIPLKYSIEENNQLYWENTSYICSMLINLSANKQSLSELDESQRNSLREIVKNPPTTATALARSILMQIDSNYSYTEPVDLPPDMPQNKSTKPIIEKPKPIEKLEVYPNPANDFVTLTYEINDASLAGLQLIICDATGKTVYTKALVKPSDYLLIVLKDYAKGNYIASIMNNQKTIKSCKFIVQ